MMEFDYEITSDVYVAAHAKYASWYFRERPNRRPFDGRTINALLGVLLIAIASDAPVFHFSSLLLGIIGAWWFLRWLLSFFPALHLRRVYRASGLEGQRYHAELDEQGFSVAGIDYGWKTTWSGLTWRYEGKTMFVFLAAGVFFIFGKKYLSDEQQGELRSLAGL